MKKYVVGLGRRCNCRWWAAVVVVIHLSLVVTCRGLHMDSFLYLRDVFTRLPGLPADRLDELLPNRWLEAHPEARHPPERQGHEPPKGKVKAA